MKQGLTALAAGIIGLIFGLGLIVSEMVNPAKILAFLDVAGEWDPSLALVMGGALIVAGVGYRVVLARRSPFLSKDFHLPEKVELDGKLVAGSVLFGIGWGATGLCPGPAFAVLLIGPSEIVIFFAAMVGGIIIFKTINHFLIHQKINHPQNTPIDG